MWCSLAIVACLVALQAAAKPTLSVVDDSGPAPSFEMVAHLLPPAGSRPIFRSVALHLPWAYVLSRNGALYIFELPTKGAEKEVRATKIIQKVGDGDDLKVVGGTLICTREGGLDVYSLGDPSSPKLAAQVRPEKRRDSQTIVLQGRYTYLVGKRSLLIYDITKPLAPKLLSEQETERYCWTGCVCGRFLYLGQLESDPKRKNGIAVYDITVPDHPLEVGFVPTSRTPYDLFAVSEEQILVSLDSDSRFVSGSSSGDIPVNGNSALFALSRPGLPALRREFSKSGGRSVTIMSAGSRRFLVCKGAVFSLENDDLKRCYSFPASGMTLDRDAYASSTRDGFPYHGSSANEHAALAFDTVVTVIRLKPRK